LPWNAWLNVATLPDGWTAALIASAAIAVTAPARRGRPPRSDVQLAAAIALLAASLSRYEAWPACAMFAMIMMLRAARTGGGLRSSAARRDVTCALIAAAGPALWLIWNAHAHGNALHFVARVTAYRRAIGAANIPLVDKLLGFPRALVREMPGAAVLGLAGVAGLVAHAPLRRRWLSGAAIALAVLIFLVLGDMADGAPTHHPARALCSIGWVLVGMGVDALTTMTAILRGSSVRTTAKCALAAATVLWCASLPARWARAPGQSEAERRDTQIARGLDLRARGVAAADVTPCAFEHFALIAAWGHPERARILPREDPAPVVCPRIVERESSTAPGTGHIEPGR
ncbi:MAG: hypothetical protein ACREJ3_11955, partial [Polyangiaceae bacterium]